MKSKEKETDEEQKIIGNGRKENETPHLISLLCKHKHE